MLSGLTSTMVPGPVIPTFFTAHSTMLLLLALHTIDNVTIHVNPAAIVSLHKPREPSMVHDNAKCVITTVDGKFISVLESCGEILDKLHYWNPPH